jgi:glycosyltransferase involved in cell wall biosynthesis
MVVDKAKLHIAILGSRGIPNRYGGFEQLATALALRLKEAGHRVSVYTPHHHPVKERKWKGVHRILCFDPEPWAGPAGHFLYDLFCILDSRRRSFDVILHLGYTTSALWFPLHLNKHTLITNMDGLEWSRSKYPSLIRAFLRWSEARALKYSSALIADSGVIRSYLSSRHNCTPAMIAYGADIPAPDEQDMKWLESMGLRAGGYDLGIARFQEDNHLEMILNGWEKSAPRHPLVMVGNADTRFGKHLRRKFENKGAMFPGSIYDADKLRALRMHSRMYFHGHSAGGTNPSLLEAMAAGALVCAHDNAFNHEVLENNALYFKTEDDICSYLNAFPSDWPASAWQKKNLERIRQHYNWDRIAAQYLELMEKYGYKPF